MAPGERVLDLCGGSGAVSREALKRLARGVVLLDVNPRYTPDPVHYPYFRAIRGRAEDAAELLRGRKFDLIVCRQALGYVDIHDVARATSLLLHRGGRFVFNNFEKPKWSARFYDFNSTKFFEASAYIGRKVFHVQAGKGLGIDLTAFRWYRHDEVMMVMQAKYRLVQFEKRAKGYYYQCSNPY